jgi:hypothetical protein
MRHRRIIAILSTLATLALVLYLLGSLVNRGDDTGRRVRDQSQRLVAQNHRIQEQDSRIEELTAAQRESAEQLAGALRNVQAAEEAARAAGQVPKQTLDQAIAAAEQRGVDPKVVRAAVREVRAAPGPRGPSGPAGPKGSPGMDFGATTTTSTIPPSSTTTTTMERPSCFISLLGLVQVAC